MKYTLLALIAALSCSIALTAAKKPVTPPELTPPAEGQLGPRQPVAFDFNADEVIIDEDMKVNNKPKPKPIPSDPYIPQPRF